MFEVRTDIWNYHRAGFYIVVPTNIGWKRNGDNVMGAGLAKQVARRYPNMPKVYGAWCKQHYDRILVRRDERLIFFPTKPCDPHAPYMSWQNVSEIETIRKSVAQLADWTLDNETTGIAMPYVGCGNGELDWWDVKPVIRSMVIPNLTIVDVNAKMQEISQILSDHDQCFLIAWLRDDWGISEIKIGHEWGSGDPDHYLSDNQIDFGDNPWTAQNYYEMTFDWTENYADESDWQDRIEYLEKTS